MSQKTNPWGNSALEWKQHRLSAGASTSLVVSTPSSMQDGMTSNTYVLLWMLASENQHEGNNALSSPVVDKERRFH